MKDNEVPNWAEGNTDEVKVDIQMQGKRKERYSEIFFFTQFLRKQTFLIKNYLGDSDQQNPISFKYSSIISHVYIALCVHPAPHS